MLPIILAVLVALAALLVVAEPFIVAGWATAAATVEQVDQQANDGGAEYIGRHRAPDPEAATVRIERAAYWPPAANLTRPYCDFAATGGAR